MDEFALIELILGEQRAVPGAGIVVGPGDDAAVLAAPAGRELVVSTDSVVSERHFPRRTPADVLGYRALAVNLSDLAAMGADPAWYTIALTAPELEPEWARAFGAGLATAAGEASIALVGGNVSRGPLAVTVTVIGTLPAGSALVRSGAREGDRVLVSGLLGEARAGLAWVSEAPERAATVSLAGRASLPAPVERYFLPRARLELGRALRGRASACIDLSDGLLADLGHVCRASGVGATLALEALPVGVSARRAALAAGDDYELCFTAAPERVESLRAACRDAGVEITEVGEITAAVGVRCVDADGREVDAAESGFRHF